MDDPKDIAKCQKKYADKRVASARIKMGEAVPKGEAKTARQLHRVKTYAAGVMLNNRLVHSADKGLKNYVVQKNDDGTYKHDVYEWESLNVATDMGPDMVSRGSSSCS